jgi:hypothetical protein
VPQVRPAQHLVAAPRWCQVSRITVAAIGITPVGMVARVPATAAIRPPPSAPSASEPRCAVR